MPSAGNPRRLCARLMGCVLALSACRRELVPESTAKVDRAPATPAVPPEGFAEMLHTCSVDDVCDAGPWWAGDLGPRFAVDSGFEWVTAPNGTLLTWQPDGWRRAPSPPQSVRALWAFDRTRAWAVGAEGGLFRFSGAAWTQVAGKISGDAVRLAASSADDVWAVAHACAPQCRSTIGHWDGHGFSTKEMPGALRGIWSVRPNDVWTVGDDKGRAVAYHFDGQQWSSRAVEGSSLTDVWGPGANDVWAVGADGLVLRWQGSKWQRQVTQSHDPFGVAKEVPPWARVFGNKSGEVWFFRTNLQNELLAEMHWDGKQFGSADAAGPTPWHALGPTFAATQAEALSHARGVGLTSVSVDAAGTVTVAGYAGVVLRGDDKGWRGFVSRDSGRLQTTNGLWAGGEGALYPVTAAGLGPKRAIAPYQQITCLYQAAPNVMWLGLDQTAPVHWGDGPRRKAGVFVETNQSLKAWPEWSRLAGADAVPSSLWASGPGDVWIAARGGALVHSDGKTMAAVRGGLTSNLQGLYGSAPDDVWGVGEGGHIVHFDGKTWTFERAPTDAALFAVWTRSRKNTWAVGAAGTALHWDGTQWKLVRTGTTRDLRGVAGGPSDVWMVGDGGTVLRIKSR